MRDFEREVHNSAVFNGRVQASEFSWSASRDRLFSFCERAYFIRYYLAQGGWDKFSDALVRSAYVEKNLQTFGSWLASAMESAVSASLKEVITSDPLKRKKAFSRCLLRRISSQVSDLQLSLKNGEYLDDPKRPSISEFHHAVPPYASLGAIVDEAVKALSNAYGIILRSELIDDLLSRDFMDYRLDDSFMYFDYRSFPVWFRPGITSFSARTVSMLTFRPVYGTEGPCRSDMYRTRIKAALFEEYVQRKWKGQYSTFTVAADFSSSSASLSVVEPVEDVLSIIDASSAQMLSRVDMSGTVCTGDFEKNCDEKLCRTCQFADTCRRMDGKL